MKNIEKLSKRTVGPDYKRIKVWGIVAVAVLALSGAACAMLLSMGNKAVTDLSENEDLASSLSATVVDQDEIHSIRFDQSSATVNVGGYYLIRSHVDPIEYESHVLWKTSDPTIATVDKTGKVSALAPGIVMVSAESEKGYCIAKCQVICHMITPLKGYEINTSSETMMPGDNLALVVRKVFEAATDMNGVTTAEKRSDIEAGILSWSSSDPEVATVNATTGEVTAVNFGKCVITATSREEDRAVATCAITVYSNVDSVTLDSDKLSMSIGVKKTLKATVLPTTVLNRSVTWASENTSIATVSASGVVTGVGNGTTNITCTSADGEKSARCTVVVTPTVEKLFIDKETLSMKLYETTSLKTSVWPESLPDKSVKWSSSKQSVVSIEDNGKMMALNYGQATITATLNVDPSVKVSCLVTVDVPAESLALEHTELRMLRGDTQKLRFAFTPSNVIDKSVTWSSSNEAVATVDVSGKVTAVNAGNATITCTSVNGNKSATCEVIVSEPISSISLNKSSLSVSVGTESEKISLSVTPSSSQAYVRVYSMSSSIATVAQSSDYITVTGVYPGKTTIVCEATDGSGKKYELPVSVNAKGAEAFTTMESGGGLVLTGLTSDWRTYYTGNTMQLPNVIRGYDVVGIGDGAFKGQLGGIYTVVMPETISYVGAEAFANNADLATVKMPGVKTVLAGAFCNSGVSDVSFGSKLTRIGAKAFMDCASLREISLPDSLQYIENDAFRNSVLRSITIPGNVKELGTYAFFNAELETVLFNTTSLKIIPNSSFGMNKLEQVLVPENVETIGTSAFAGNARLKTVSMPDTVTYIHSGAFEDCTLLEAIYMSDNIINLDSGAALNGISSSVLYYTTAGSATEGLLRAHGVPESSIRGK